MPQYDRVVVTHVGNPVRVRGQDRGVVVIVCTSSFKRGLSAVHDTVVQRTLRAIRKDGTGQSGTLYSQVQPDFGFPTAPTTIVRCPSPVISGRGAISGRSTQRAGSAA